MCRSNQNSRPIDIAKITSDESSAHIRLACGDDRGSRIWTKVEDDWRKAGVPLTVDYVPHGKHQWLVAGDRVQELDDWLAAVAAGKLPSGPPANAPK